MFTPDMLSRSPAKAASPEGPSLEKTILMAARCANPLLEANRNRFLT